MATEKQRETALRNLEKARQAPAARARDKNIPRQAEKGAGADHQAAESNSRDAEREGDTELAEFFRRAQGESRKGAEQGKERLASRLPRARKR